jgi:hypothetical protein
MHTLDPRGLNPDDVACGPSLLMAADVRLKFRCAADEILGNWCIKGARNEVSGRKSGPSGTLDDSLPGEVLSERSIPDLL